MLKLNSSPSGSKETIFWNLTLLNRGNVLLWYFCAISIDCWRLSSRSARIRALWAELACSSVGSDASFSNFNASASTATETSNSSMKKLAGAIHAAFSRLRLQVVLGDRVCSGLNLTEEMLSKCTAVAAAEEINSFPFLCLLSTLLHLLCTTSDREKYTRRHAAHSHKRVRAYVIQTLSIDCAHSLTDTRTGDSLNLDRVRPFELVPWCAWLSIEGAQNLSKSM